MQNFSINRLISGGLITNYNCVSQCKHCLYACSYKRDKSYITAETSAIIFRKMKEMNCQSIHVGGGEPFMDIKGLEQLLFAAKKEGVVIEYVETNSSWYKTPKQAEDVLLKLKMAGLEMLLISISPFHNEFIPFSKVKGVIKACNKVGIAIFPWTQEFYYDLVSLDDANVHSNDEFEAHFGSTYFKQIPYRYWIHYGGRALSFYEKTMSKTPLEQLLTSEPCNEILDTFHFHIDLYGNYIPGLCTGMSISLDDLGKPLDESQYRLLNQLVHKGLSAIYEIAGKEYGFIAKDMYINKCHLCSDIRKHIVLNGQVTSKELQPAEFYSHL